MYPDDPDRLIVTPAKAEFMSPPHQPARIGKSLRMKSSIRYGIE
jgi:hypothetical protein